MFQVFTSWYLVREPAKLLQFCIAKGRATALQTKQQVWSEFSTNLGWSSAVARPNLVRILEYEVMRERRGSESDRAASLPFLAITI